MKWESWCPLCKRDTQGINNYFCIQNRRTCENCLAHKPLEEIKKNKEYDPFAKWRKPVDKNKKKLNK